MLRPIPIRFLLVALCLPMLCYGQGRKKTSWEIGGFLGASNYIGDLAPDIAWNKTKGVIGATAKYNLNNYVAFGGQVNFGAIAGSDSNFKSLQYRGLSFRSTILEFSAQGEFNFFRFGYGPRAKRYTPYLYTGISVFKFNPRADYNGEGYFLRNYSTEGQGIVEKGPRKYSLFQVAVPIGAGFKFSLNDHWNLAVHGAYRTTFTDYLDDVSGVYADPAALAAAKGMTAVYFADPNQVGRPQKQRGNPDNNDWYIFAGVTLSYVIEGSSCFTF